MSSERRAALFFGLGVLMPWLGVNGTVTGKKQKQEKVTDWTSSRERKEPQIACIVRAMASGSEEAEK